MKLAVFLLASSVFAFVWAMSGFNWMNLPGDPGTPNLFNIFMMGVSYLLFVLAIVRATYTLFEDKDYVGPKYDHPSMFIGMRK